jgi:hypothetical protein
MEESKMFNSCESLKEITFDFNTIKSSKMVMLDKMNFNQIQWCEKLGIIKNLKPNVAKELNMCAFYAIIDYELISEFDSI